MSGFWYTAAIATTVSAVVILAKDLAIPSRYAPASPFSVGQVERQQVKRQQVGRRQVERQPKNRTIAQDGALPDTLIEQNASRTNFEQAMAIARQAVDAYQSARAADTPEASLAFTRKEKRLWQSSLQKLSNIPKDASIYQQANHKKAHYKTLLATAAKKVLAAESAFLTDIIESAQISPTNVHISLCQIDLPRSAPSEAVGASTYETAYKTADETESGYSSNGCRHHKGEQLLASPASLIKLPIAIAVLDKIHTEKLDLNSKLYIDPQNFTENAIGATIEVDKEYPLVQVIDRMISESNNIATNQLIDYVGREGINKTLTARGYQDTFVDYKLAGNRILPPNPGTQSNRITTNDVTRMMVDTYRLSHPDDGELLQALTVQKDQELGYQALREVGSAVEWLGEKTGQNGRMLGTTLAMKIDAKRYALTVAINYSADAIALRKLIKGIAHHLIENGPIAQEFEHAKLEPLPASPLAKSITKPRTARPRTRSGANHLANQSKSSASF
ncbi:hypothetical protein S7335_4771 [Synechococcus sp. PCC 7335]|uniref:serine hydrolase n=1 Tax=Synechococcus sp. (strain ATCC 29403 / PCC 7335) TaxID=91464 RepID=UPI00017EC710|nr:serine hydrolase [Synechococcus sp. PCC 7335]EDX87064.1 hypothetical protein S7335_4771 [Synechococcus sp. PCC 7335]